MARLLVNRESAHQAPEDGADLRPHALRVDALTKLYGETRALDSVSATFVEGQVTAVVGANGSGKSTLLKVLSGSLSPTAGQVSGPGDRPIGSIRQAHDLGVVLVPQEPTLAPHLKVWQNITLTHPERRFGPFRHDRRAKESAAEHIAGLLPVDVLERTTGELNKSTRQLVQLAAAMAAGPKVLLLDEPTAVLDEDGVGALHALVRRFVAKGGTVLVVSHRLRDVLALADEAVLLRNGRVDLAMPIDESTEASIMRLLSAEEHATRAPRDSSEAEVVLVARELSGWRGLEIADLKVHAGEIVGIAGQSGSGRSRLAAVLAGRYPARGQSRWVAGECGSVACARLAHRGLPSFLRIAMRRGSWPTSPLSTTSCSVARTGRSPGVRFGGVRSSAGRPSRWSTCTTCAPQTS